MEQLLVRAGMIVLMVALATLISIYARRRPNHAKKRPGATRMPKFVGIVGWLILVVGLFMSLAAFASNGGTDPTGARIASLFIVMMGAFFAWIYHNFWYSFRPDGVDFRTIFGQRRSIDYHQIATYRVSRQRGMPMVRVVAADGTRFSMNCQTYDMTPLLQAIAYREREGYWPTSYEAMSRAPRVRLDKY